MTGFAFVYGESTQETEEIDRLVGAVEDTEVVATLAPHAMYSKGIVTDTLVDLETCR